MVKWLCLWIFIGLLSACNKDEPQGYVEKESTNTGLTCQLDDTLTNKAIYGVDNRLDWYESPGQTKEYWARATVALMAFGDLSIRQSGALVVGPRYQDAANLCPGQPFADQPSAGFCSGFLVAPDLVVTAGHCLRNQDECEATYFVFDYAKKTPEQQEFPIPLSSVYRCSELVTRQTGSSDFAVVKLDRRVEDRTPLNINRSQSLRPGDQVMLIGHPMGLPSKIADGGFVQSIGNRIVATVDAFAANSGSVILNSRTGLVEGLLVAGELDYRFENGCRVENYCGRECAGEQITPIQQLMQHIPNMVYDNPICE